MLNMRTVGIYLVIFIGALIVLDMLQNKVADVPVQPYSQFMTEAKEGKVTSVTVQGSTIVYSRADSSVSKTYNPGDSHLVSDMLKYNVKVESEPAPKQSLLVSFLLSWGPMLLIGGIILYSMKAASGGKGGPFSFGKNKAKMLPPGENRVSFADVAGCDEAKADVAEIVDFLKEPSQYHALGGQIPKGVLLAGSPGTGKTLLAKAIAGEANVPFFTISGSDFVEMFVGVGASRVRDLFAEAKKNAPCIIFIDEIDAVGRKRGAGHGGGNDEREQTLNQLLVEMDGFEGTSGIIIIAATNRPDVLDPALLRPGRFDRQVTVGLPDIVGRKQILTVHARKTPIGKDVDIETIAKGCPGFSGAELANLVNEAALCAARGKKKFIDMSDFEKAKDKIIMGAARNVVMPEEERRNTAYHEAGHALVAHLLPKTDPVHKISIIPRGRALGVTVQLPTEDKYSKDKQALMSTLAVLFGGRIAEEIFMDQMTTGASNDFERASAIARKMVTQWGMSKLGVAVYGATNDSFLGSESEAYAHVSETTKREIDQEINGILNAQYRVARQLIEDNKEIMHTLAKYLLEWETLDDKQFVAIMNGATPAEPQEAPVPALSTNEVAQTETTVKPV